MSIKQNIRGKVRWLVCRMLSGSQSLLFLREREWRGKWLSYLITSVLRICLPSFSKMFGLFLLRQFHRERHSSNFHSRTEKAEAIFKHSLEFSTKNRGVYHNIFGICVFWGKCFYVKRIITNNLDTCFFLIFSRKRGDRKNANCSKKN